MSRIANSLTEQVSHRNEIGGNASRRRTVAWSFWMAALGVTLAISALGADAHWIGGSGCLTGDALMDTTKWTADPRHSAKTSGPWVCFKKATQDEANPLDYTVTLSEDLRVNSVFQNVADLTVHMQFHPYTFYTSFGDAMRLQGKNAVLSLEGGTICSKDLADTYRSINFWDGVEGFEFRVDGPTAVLDASLNMRGGYGCRVVVANGAHLLRPLDIHGYCNNLAIVTGEGTYVDYLSNNNLNVGGWHKKGDVTSGTRPVTNNCMRVTDRAELRNISEIRCGDYGSYSLLDVDGGCIFAKSAYVGTTQYASNNVLRIANASTFELTSPKYVVLACQNNTNPGSCGNRLVFDCFTNDCTKLTGFATGTTYDWEGDFGIGASNNSVRVSGSKLTIPATDGKFYVAGGANNGMVVADGSVVCMGIDADGTKGNGGAICLGDGNYSHGAYLVVTGAGTVVSNFNQNVGTRIGMRSARNCRLEVLDGAAFHSEKGISVSGSSNGAVTQGGGHLIRVAGGLLTSDETLNLGREMSAGGACASNRVEVSDGGEIKVRMLRLHGQGNAIIVSNGTLMVDFEFRTNYENTEECGGRTTVVFAGARPCFRVNGPYADFQREATIRFEIPAEGYETVPFEAAYGFTVRDSRAEFDVERYRRAGGGTLTLMRAGTAGSGTISMTDEQLATLREGLPSGCRLTLAADRKELRLKVSPYALIMTIR